MIDTPQLGFAHFIAQADTVGKTLLVVLVLMSIWSWYVIVTRSAARLFERRRSARFLDEFWAASSLEEVGRRITGEGDAQDPFARITQRAFKARGIIARNDVPHLETAGAPAEYLTRVIRQGLEDEAARSESGLTPLATIGATAPFVGLFGTVWGVYGALVAIGQTGSGTLDKVAGPVGEALIMTGIGLAVAIPAVVGYNALVRSNRVISARLDSFAHDLYSLLIVGDRARQTVTSGGR